MRKVELIYDADCPNVQAAREQLRRACHETGQSPIWQEWDRARPSTPAHIRCYGSPTILIDGKDVAGGAPSEGADCCRLYRAEDGTFRGVPAVETITAALTNGSAASGTGLGAWLAVLPAAGVAMLPNLACPACWPAYAGLLGSIGLGYLTQTRYLLPLTVAFLVLAVGGLGFRARTRHGYGPFLVGIIAAIVVVVGKFLFASNAAMYGGIALLIGASLWSTWPKRTKRTSCPACAEAGKQ